MKPSKNHTKAGLPKTQGNNFSIALLVIPICLIVWGFSSGLRMPFDQVSLLKKALLSSAISFVIIWYLSFRKTRRGPTLVAVSAFLAVLWFFGIIFGMSKTNEFFDSSSPEKHIRKAIRKQKISGGRGGSGFRAGSPSCAIWLDRPIQGIEVAHIKYEECDVVDVGIDGVLVELKSGAIGMSWVFEHSVVKDVDAYQRRLGF